MREIITVQVGSGGNQIGEKFFHLISGEHGIDGTGNSVGKNPIQTERLEVYFKELITDNYVIRGICVDTDNKSIEQIRNSKIGGLLQENNLIHGDGGTGNNYGKCYYDSGARLLEQIMSSIRNELEEADSMQGVQLIHTLGGGTGSGLTALLLEKLSDEQYDIVSQTISIIPSERISSAVVDPYNFMLGFPNLLEHTHLTFCIDNEILYNIYTNNYKFAITTFKDTNHLIAYTMSGITTCLRFPGQSNAGLRKLYTNMIPYKNLHFLVPGFAPLTTSDMIDNKKIKMFDLLTQLFNPKNLFANPIDIRTDKILTSAVIIRGLISTKEAEFELAKIRQDSLYVDWLPHNIKSEFCNIPPYGLRNSATFICNTSGLAKLFKRIDDKFLTLFKRKAHLNWYQKFGVEELHFEESHDKLIDLIQEYKNQVTESIV